MRDEVEEFLRRVAQMRAQAEAQAKAAQQRPAQQQPPPPPQQPPQQPARRLVPAREAGLEPMEVEVIDAELAESERLGRVPRPISSAEALATRWARSGNRRRTKRRPLLPMPSVPGSPPAASWTCCFRPTASATRSSWAKSSAGRTSGGKADQFSSSSAMRSTGREVVAKSTPAKMSARRMVQPVDASSIAASSPSTDVNVQVFLSWRT
jgi:hypothetical protein